LEVLGIEDTDFDKTIERCASAAAKRAKEIYDRSLKCESASRLRPDGKFKLTISQ
jgi:hypothetical protein